MKNRKVLAAVLWLLSISTPSFGQSLGLDRIAVVVNYEAITDLEVKQRISQSRSLFA